MTTIGIDLGWRQARMVVLNDLHELIPIPPANRSEDSTTRYTGTAPLVAKKGDRDSVVGGDALFGLYHPGEWDVVHALAAAKAGDVLPLTAVLSQLKADLKSSGYPIGDDLAAEIRVTTDKNVPADLLMAALNAAKLNNAALVPRYQAARAYSQLLLDDEAKLSRLSDNKKPGNSIVLDLGFCSQCVSLHDNEVASYIDRDLPIASSKLPAMFQKPIIESAFGTWATFVSDSLMPDWSNAAYGFREMHERDVYRYFDDWWKQILPGGKPQSTSRPREAPFMLPTDVTPSAKPFVGCTQDEVIARISDAMWTQLRSCFTGWVPKRQPILNWMDGAPLILIGQYCDVPKVANHLAERLQQLFWESVQSGKKEPKMRIVRLPTTGLAAGAAIAAA